MPVKTNFWGPILSELETDLSPASFKIWFAKTTQLEVVKNGSGGIAKISCPSSFVRDTIKTRFLKQINKISQRLNQTGVTFELVVGRQAPAPKQQTSLFTPTSPKKTGKGPMPLNNLNPQYTFETFVVGPSNQVAVAAARAISQSPGSTYNPLFLFGGVGLGKTHLIQAVAHQIIKNNPKTKVLYTTSEAFINDLIGALRKQKMSVYKNKYRRVDVLLIDDIQFIAGKTFVQEEFFHTFNSLYMQNKQVIVTADSPPDEITGLPKRIISRFKGGLAIDIQPLDYETRRGIIYQKTKLYNLPLDAQVVELLASHPFDNVREIEGFIIKLETLSKINGQPIDPELIRSLLGSNRPIKRYDAKKIIKTVSFFFKVKPKDIKGPSRQAQIARARQVAMYLCRQELKLPLTTIGRLFGGRDHSTVIHSVEKIAKMFTTNQQVRNDIISIKGELERF